MKYSICDTRAPILDDLPEIEADSAKEAVQILLKEKGIEGSVSRGSGNDVRFCTTAFVEKEGQKIKVGRNCWWTLINTPEKL